MANARAGRRGRVRAREAAPAPARAPPTPADDALATASMSSAGSLDARPDHEKSQAGRERRRVLLSDAQLAARARETAAAIDFPALTSAAALRGSWRHKARAGGFTTYSRELAGGEGSLSVGDDDMGGHPLGGRRAGATKEQLFEVLAIGELACGLEELAHALRATSDVSFNAAMSGIHKKDYIYGSVVHVVPVGDDRDEAGGSSLGSQPGPPRLQSLASVKTSTFVRSGMFGQNEQWCFLELFRASRFSRSFFVTTSSLPARLLNIGKAQHGRVDHLHGLVTGYWVEELPAIAPNTKTTVRVVFYGQFTPNTVRNEGSISDGGAYANSSAAKKRLLRLARATCYLEEVVRRRRLGAQTLADRSAFDPKNSRCICCTKSLGLLTTKKRCYLCGYAVCDNCWSIQKMETGAGQISTLRVCARCLEFVDAGDYSHVTPETLGPVQVVPDGPNDDTGKKSNNHDSLGASSLSSNRIPSLSSTQSSAAKKPMPPPQPQDVDTFEPAPMASKRKVTSVDDVPPPTPVMLSDLLQDALKDEYYKSRKQSVMTVMQQLLEEEQVEKKATSARAKAVSVSVASHAAATAFAQHNRTKSMLASSPPSMASSSTSTWSCRSSTRSTTTSKSMSVKSNPESDLMETLEASIEGESLPLSECVHATSGGTRKYALAPKEAPVPMDESTRLAAIEHGNLMKLGNSEELDVLCKLAAREMGCSTSVVTIVGQHEQVVLASNHKEMKQSHLPRQETFCQHTVMGDAPLLVPHPEADVRFQSIAARTQGGRDYRFYAGFPIRGENDAVVGAICVLDEQSHSVSQAQYSAMQRLAATASKVVKQKTTPAAA